MSRKEGCTKLLLYFRPTYLDTDPRMRPSDDVYQSQ